jgi:site-specific DNA recombinase
MIFRRILPPRQFITSGFGCWKIRCGFCGRPVTGERKIKRTKHGEQAYVYYRCTRYNIDGHPRLRVREADLDREVISLFERIRIRMRRCRGGFGMSCVTGSEREQTLTRRGYRRRQLSSLQQQCDRLRNMRLGDEIDEATFAEKSTELRDRIARLESEAASHSDKHRSDTAEKLFELSQTLTQKWLSANVRTKRRLLEIVCLNFSLDGVSLVPTMRKPFDVLVEGLSVPLSRGDKI